MIDPRSHTQIVAARSTTAQRINVASSQWAYHLKDEGYCIIPDVMPAENVMALATDLAPAFEATARSIGPFYGNATKRFHSLLRRSPHTAAFVQHPLVLGIVEAILGPFCDIVQLNLTQAIELLPGSYAQPPHRDQDMWPVHTPGIEYMINVMWPFTRYTKENGATLVWPGSHRRLSESIIDSREALAAEMEPGSALLFLGSTLHGGGANRTDRARRGMIVSYCLGWLKPYELPWLAYPPEVARSFDPGLATLTGYRAHRPNLGTFEGRCPSMLLAGNMPSSAGAIDTLRPEQEALIALYRAQSTLLDDAAAERPDD